MTTAEGTETAVLGQAAGLQPERPGAPFPYRYNADGSGGPGPKYLRTEVLLGREGDGFLDRWLVRLAERVIGIGAVNEICLRAGTPWPSSTQMIDHLFKELSIRWSVTNPESFDNLPEGPLVFVANHPYGMADAFAMNNMLEKWRPNFRLFANSFLTMADSITHKLLFVDPFMSESNRGMNRRSMAAAMRHLRDGGDLAIFPGRICSHLKWGSTCVQDGEWTSQIRAFAEAGNAHVVPVHVSGRNSWRFQAAGLIHPRLRTLLILREFLAGNREFAFTLGEPVPAVQLAKAARVVPAGTLARAMTYAANPGIAPRPRLVREAPIRPSSIRRPKAVPQVVLTAGELEKAVRSLPLLASHGEFDVHNSVNGLREGLEGPISRVRFDAFSAEASLTSPDDMIDRFDTVYSHLVLWDRENRRVAGTYRYVVPSSVSGGMDQGDLVTASIFRLRGRFRAILPRAMELGRAAIHPDYQRSYAPLMVMWRAIMQVLMDDTSIKYLFGPLTISRSFSPLSRHVLRHFMETRLAWPPFAGSAVPLHPFRASLAPQINLNHLIAGAENLVDIGSIVEAIEGGRRKLPVLYRQYANFGMRCIATGEWPELDNSMASLALLDLASADRGFISRYLDKDKVDGFFATRAG